MIRIQKTQKTNKQKILTGVGIGLITLGLLLGLWLFLDYRAGKPIKPASLGVKITSLQNDSAIVPEYKTYNYLIKEDWVKQAGFDLHKRLYPQNDAGGVIRFKPPTEYFEVGLSSDVDKGISNINVVGVSMHTSGVTNTLSDAVIDQLFEKGSVDGSYDTVKTQADGRVKASIASNGCFVQASGFEKEKVRKLVSILFQNCVEVLKKS
jgi:hypothetical protein